mmetsp:Transcript_17791/g.26535  ORF Transcript_17791/g.26535 Transcript_17791/m.26535 type:complete len:80 (-) Transcript_17791:151-390(-)
MSNTIGDGSKFERTQSSPRDEIQLSNTCTMQKHGTSKLQGTIKNPKMFAFHSLLEKAGGRINISRKQKIAHHQCSNERV